MQRSSSVQLEYVMFSGQGISDAPSRRIPTAKIPQEVHVGYSALKKICVFAVVGCVTFSSYFSCFPFYAEHVFRRRWSKYKFTINFERASNAYFKEIICWKKYIT